MKGSIKIMKKFIFLFILCTLCISFTGCGISKLTENSDTSISSSVSSDLSEDTDTNKWKVKYYVDSFNDPTDKKYINYVDIGTFSNTATDDSELIYSIMMDVNGTSIKLYEYGSSLVKNSYSDAVKYQISTKSDDGTVNFFYGSMQAKTGDRIVVDDDDNSFSLTLWHSNKVKFHIVNLDSPSSYYDFTVDTTGISEAYEQIYI